MAAREPGRPRHATGTIRGVARIPAEDVPTASPVSVDASRALAFEVRRDDSDADGDVVRVFEAWPTGGHAGSRLARLLDAVGESMADPEALEGARVALERRDDEYRVDVERTRRLHEQGAPASVETHSLTEVPILGGAVAGLLAFFATRTTYGWAAVPLAAFAAVTLAVSLGVDAWRTEDATWSPRALPWAIGGLVPALNVAVATSYLVRKTAAVDAPEAADEVWRDLLVGATAVFATGLVLAAFDPLLGLGATLFVHAWLLAPVAVYLDGPSGRHDGAAPNRPAWVAGAAVLGGAGALIYLLRTDLV
jgi:hypothetical protein